MHENCGLMAEGFGLGANQGFEWQTQACILTLTLLFFQKIKGLNPLCK